MTEIGLLLTQIDQAYNRRSWHGTNLRGSVRGMTPEDAVWRPQSSRHNIQEIVVHAAYWKYVVRRRITGGTRGSFPLEGSNSFARRHADANAWRADLRLLEDCHRQLRETIAALDARRLHRTAGGSTTALALVTASSRTTCITRPDSAAQADARGPLTNAEGLLACRRTTCSAALQGCPAAVLAGLQACATSGRR